MALPTLAPQQEAAVKAAVEWFASTTRLRGSSDDFSAAPYFYLGGFAGTGKSHCLPVIIDAMRLNPEDVEFVAPTAKAAKVMGSKLRPAGITKKPRTIHSLIYQPKPLKAEVLEKQLADLISLAESFMVQGLSRSESRVIETARSIEVTRKELDKAYTHVEGPRFSLNAESCIVKALLVVVDEASMVGTEIADDLRGFGVPILAMGDPGQLPPINDEPGLTNREPDYFLTDIHRQAKDNPIIHLATLARNGEELPIGRMVHGDFFAEVVERRNDKATYDLERDAQLLVGTNRKRWMLVQKLRHAMGYRSNAPCEGEPLIMRRNSRKVPDLVNGSMVQCTKDVGDLVEGDASILVSIEDEVGMKRTVSAVQGMFEEHFLKVKGAATAPNSSAFRAKKDCEHLDWAWACTVHSSQGSQWPDVIVHDESGVFQEHASRHLYTAVTRAAERLTVVV